ncbi:MAG: thiol protease/hemagglutinin PrtT [Bacteroidales bacterium]|nr:thiol protease/hemagglutinin PrtT [Bacteroidales bacterium]
MKKTVVFAMALAMLTLGATAAPVDRAATRTVAANFWNTYRPADVKAVSADELVLVPLASMPFLNVYANGTDGFVVVSADDRAIPVPAYSFDSPFPERLNPAVRYWLDAYNAQIAEAVELDLQAEPDASWKSLLTATPPAEPLTLVDIPAMLTTRWDQGSPYNRYCPYDTVLNDHSVVGCVATAMAQLMKYWNHPSCGTGHHSYYLDESYASYAYGTLSADFANTTYIWNHMPTSLSYISRSHEIEAVATLSYHCGVAVEMMYSPEASGAYTVSYGNPDMACSEKALKDYFRYKRTLHGEERYRHNQASWKSMIDDDIAAGRPVLYTGHDNSGGHAFVLDGSDTVGRYHFNFGWSGYGDGFYTINNIAPGGGGAGGNSTYTFNSGQTAVFGVEPIPQYFDTVDFYDTVCASDGTYRFYEYTLPATAGTHTLIHLETVYNVHLAVTQSRYAYMDPNGGEGNTRVISFCPSRGIVMPENTFSRNGWEFAGWCLDDRGNGTLYQPGDTVPLRTSKFFYAIWQRPGNVSIATSSDDDIAVWPKIASQTLNLSLSSDAEASITVVDTYGRVVIEQRTLGRKAKISLERLPAGAYTLIVLTADTRYNTRIIKL